MMRFVLMTAVCMTALAVSGCSKSEPDRSSYAPDRSPPAPRDRTPSVPTNNAPAANSDSMADSVAPGVDVTAAPGVAFNYSYAFRLPSAAIKDAQEAHAQTCEKLGVERCRITGMRYRVNGENDIQGSIDFKLDPKLARAFGKQGIDAVVKAAGKLVDAEITGTDAGAAITKLDTQRARGESELHRIDRELARSDLDPDERAELQSQRAALLAQVNDTKSQTNDQEESLATTPVSFSYESGAAVKGFDGSAPITSAGNIFVSSATVTIGIVLTLLAAFAPPGVILLGLFLLWRRFRPRKPSSPPAA